MRQLIAALHFIATPLPLILSACPCLSTRHLHLPPPVQLLFAPAGCRVASRCPAFVTHPLDPQPFLSTRRLVVATPLVAPPLQLVLLARGCLSTRRLHLPLPFASRLPWQVVASLLVAPPLPLILSTRCCLSTRQLVVALPPVVPLSLSSVVVTHPSWMVVASHLDTPPPHVCLRLRLLSRRCLSSSALTGCCVATSASPRATAYWPPVHLYLSVASSCHRLLRPLLLRFIDASSFRQLWWQAKRSITPHSLHQESRNTHDVRLRSAVASSKSVEARL
jgi:hypothetical protein